MTTLCVLLTLGVVAVLITLLVRSSDNFCGTCQGLDTKTCPNQPLLRRLYQEGQLTENTPRHRSPRWGTTAPYDRFAQHKDPLGQPCN